LIPSQEPTRKANSTASTESIGSLTWVNQNQTIFGVIIALGVAIVCVIFVLCLRTSPTDERDSKSKSKPHQGSPMVIDIDAIRSPSPVSSPTARAPPSSSADGDNGDFGVLLRRFSNAVTSGRRKSSAADKPGNSSGRRTSSISLFKMSAEPTRIDLCSIPEGRDEVDSPVKNTIVYPSEYVVNESKTALVSSVPVPLPISAPQTIPSPILATAQSPVSVPISVPIPSPVPAQSKTTRDAADLVGARQKILDAMARNKAKQQQYASNSNSSSGESQL
jgi:hypothetical protein